MKFNDAKTIKQPIRTGISVKSLRCLFCVVTVVIMASCTTPLPPGEAPPPDVPIIIEPKIASAPRIITGEDAVNYMLTSLATQCSPIASSGKEVPEILNCFTVSEGIVNDLPMEIWHKLIKNKMIEPVSDPEKYHKYSLTSEIELLPKNVKNEKRYKWTMRLLENKPGNQAIWKAVFQFTEIPKDIP